MPIRPIDVRRKEFRNSLRGYDANQVDDFLDAVADEFERAYTDNSRMREEIASLRERLQQFEELEGSIRAALVHAEQAADDLRRSATQEADHLRRSAEREADLTVREAKARSHQILAESSARVERVQESYTVLQEAKRNFANDFRHLLKIYMDTMENMEIASAREIEASLRERLDTESIAVAREAATYEGEGAEPAPAEPELAQEETGVGSEEEAHTTEDAAATQRIEPEQMPAERPQEVEEPEAEPFVGSQEPSTEEETAVEGPSPAEEPAVAEAPAAEEVEQEEPTLAEESTSQGFFDREEGGGTSSEEGARNSRIFRASRFLRRRSE
jgi:cell division initiation protein